MSQYHFVSETDLGIYVRRLSKMFLTKDDFLEEVNNSIKVLNESPDNYIEEIRFFERVKKELLK
jgi:hypothetical protein